MSQEPFGDIPLFREIQRILAAGSGPVNLEIARQVASALATQGVTEPPIAPVLKHDFDDAVRAAEPVLSGYSRLAVAEPARTDVAGRAQWATATLDAWRWLLEHASEHFAQQLAGGDDGESSNPLQAAMGQIAPLLLGIQAGTLVGHLARDALGRYDIPVPRSDDGKLLLIGPNADEVARAYDLEPRQLTQWFAVQEVARHLVVTSPPWVGRYFRSLLIELLDAVEIDTSDLERRLMELQNKAMEMLDEGMTVEQSLPIVSTERHQRALDRFAAFTALVEGYAANAASEVAAEIMGDTARIDEGMARQRTAPSEGRTMLAGLLGISVDRTLVASGRTFCAGVVKLKGMHVLNRVWDAPDNLPSMDEIKDPFAWIDRVAAE